MKTPALSLLLTSALSAAALAEVKLPALISDNLVLQQELPANVWGWADAGEKVSVKFAGKAAETTADAKGKWSVKLTDLTSGATGDLTIAGTNTLTIKNVAVGEVWVCSGQSNMEFTVNGALNAPKEIADANFPLIRHFTVVKTQQKEPQDDCKGKWEVCSPQTVAGFTAVGYFFGRQLQQNLKVPVGLIHSSWGGTAAEQWTPTPVLNADPDFKPMVAAWEKVVAEYPAAKAKYDQDVIAWREAEKAAKAAGTTPPRQPNAPRGGDANGSPSGLYNGMIVPLLPYTVRGVTGYQGESNAGAATSHGHSRTGAADILIRLFRVRSRLQNPVDGENAITLLAGRTIADGDDQAIEIAKIVSSRIRGGTLDLLLYNKIRHFFDRFECFLSCILDQC